MPAVVPLLRRASGLSLPRRLSPSCCSGCRATASSGDPSGTDLRPTLLVLGRMLNALAGTAFPSIQRNFNPHESAIFVGLPVLIIAALFTWRTWRSGWTRFLDRWIPGALLLALGPKLTVAGRFGSARCRGDSWRTQDEASRTVSILPRFGGLRRARVGRDRCALDGSHSGDGSLADPLSSRSWRLSATLFPAAWRSLPVVHPDRPALLRNGEPVQIMRFPAHETLAIFPFEGRQPGRAPGRNGLFISRSQGAI